MPVIDDGPTLYFSTLEDSNFGVKSNQFADFNPRPISVGGQEWLGGFFGERKISNAFANIGTESYRGNTSNTSTMSRPLQQAPKVDPKVLFANERTYLAWLHVSVILAGASVAIVAMSESDESITKSSQYYGAILLPISVAFIVYAMMQYARRASIIRRQSPGPFIDMAGPIILTVILIVALVTQFAIKLHGLM